MDEYMYKGPFSIYKTILSPTQHKKQKNQGY